MKKNDIVLILSVALYSYLFYEQTAGINFLIFSLSMVMLVLIKDKFLAFNKAWIFTALGSILTSIAIVMYGNTLTVLSNVISLSLMASFSIHKSSSLILALVYSIYSYLTSIVFMVINYIDRKAKAPAGNSRGTKALLIILPVIVTIIFFFLYREANPIFKNFTKNITFDFITWSWVRFTLGGFIILYGFFNHRAILYFFNKDLEASDKLHKEKISEQTLLFGKEISKDNENLSGTVLFILLNLLLLIVNTLDINFLWISGAIPEGMTHSEFVHQGVGLLIVSIIVAIIIILFYFRGGLNFYKKNTALKLLAYAWIIQNAILIITTVSKNEMYVSEYSLTYKRIGVFIYLLLSLIGLITTFIKIASLKSNWFLFRKNGWAFYSLLILACFINWDFLITRFNIDYSKELDKTYLLSLSSTVLPNLISLSEEKDSAMEMNEAYFQNALHTKTFNFLRYWKNSEWKSWNLEESKVHIEIMHQEKTGKLTKLDLSNANITDVAPIAEFKKLRDLNLSNNKFNKVEQLSYFQKLEKLNMESNHIDSLQAFPPLKNIKDVNLSNNEIRDIKYLSKAPSLEVLILTNNRYTVYEYPNLPNLKVLDLSYTPVANYNFGKYKKLTDLKLNNTNNKDKLNSLPGLPNLESLELKNNHITSSDPVFTTIAEFKNLKRLDLTSNAIEHLNSIPNDGNVLEDLSVENNTLKNCSGIEKFTQLRAVNMSHCDLTSVEPIHSLSNLTELYLAGNRIINLTPISTLTNLKKLDLRANRVNNLLPIKNLVNLEELNLEGNSISDIGPITALIKLRKLNIRDIIIHDYSCLKKLPLLESLKLGEVPQEAIQIILQLKQLRHLKCTSLSELQVKELKKYNPQLFIETYGRHYRANEDVPVDVADASTY